MTVALPPRLDNPVYDINATLILVGGHMCCECGQFLRCWMLDCAIARGQGRSPSRRRSKISQSSWCSTSTKTRAPPCTHHARSLRARRPCCSSPGADAAPHRTALHEVHGAPRSAAQTRAAELLPASSDARCPPRKPTPQKKLGLKKPEWLPDFGKAGRSQRGSEGSTGHAAALVRRTTRLLALTRPAAILPARAPPPIPQPKEFSGSLKQVRQPGLGRPKATLSNSTPRRG